MHLPREIECAHDESSGETYKVGCAASAAAPAFVVFGGGSMGVVEATTRTSFTAT